MKPPTISKLYKSFYREYPMFRDLSSFAELLELFHKLLKKNVLF